MSTCQSCWHVIKCGSIFALTSSWTGVPDKVAGQCMCWGSVNLNIILILFLKLFGQWLKWLVDFSILASWLILDYTCFNSISKSRLLINTTKYFLLLYHRGSRCNLIFFGSQTAYSNHVANACLEVKLVAPLWRSSHNVFLSVNIVSVLSTTECRQV